jgi:hypothetical protein
MLLNSFGLLTESDCLEVRKKMLRTKNILRKALSFQKGFITAPYNSRNTSQKKEKNL